MRVDTGHRDGLHITTRRRWLHLFYYRGRRPWWRGLRWRTEGGSMHRHERALERILTDFEGFEIRREQSGEPRDYVAERLAGYAYDALHTPPPRPRHELVRHAIVIGLLLAAIGAMIWLTYFGPLA